MGLLDLVILQKKCIPEAKQIYTRQFNIVLVFPFRHSKFDFTSGRLFFLQLQWTPLN